MRRCTAHGNQLTQTDHRWRTTDDTLQIFPITWWCVSVLEKKHKFLESSLKLLQQFHIGLVSLSDEFRLFPGDCSTFSLECTQCGKYVSPPGSIGMTLFIAPYAILSHLGLKFLNEDHTTNITKEEDPSVKLELVPILFTSNINYATSVASYFDLIESCGDSIEDFNTGHSCIVQPNRSEEFLFCKAVKIDASLSDNNRKKNAQSTISFMNVLFKDLGEAIEIYKESMANITDLQRWDAKIHLFNNTNKSVDSDGSLFGQQILNNSNGLDKEVLKLLKSWCILSYREFCRNLLVLLGEVSDRIYGSKTNIPNQLLEMFGLDDESTCSSDEMDDQWYFWTWIFLFCNDSQQEIYGTTRKHLSKTIYT